MLPAMWTAFDSSSLKKSKVTRIHWNPKPLCTLSESNIGDSDMNWDRIEGNWKQFSGKVKEKWGQLTDDDLTRVNGNREQLEGVLQERYGYAKDQAKAEIDRWSNTL
jgi:uncharacterized protein YjbJ (UPF0337 family)